MHDLKPVLQEMREARREYVGRDAADVELSAELPVPPSVLWQYFVDPEKRLKWQTNNAAIKDSPNERGRTGRGSSSHCTDQSGEDFLHRYVDWRPFSYFTEEVTWVRPSLTSFRYTATVEFIPTGGGSTLGSLRIHVHRRRLLARLGAPIFARLAQRLFERMLEGHVAQLRQLLQEDGWLESPPEGADATER